jgi:hypothetical protein
MGSAANGSGQVISVPKGGGALHGIGEKFSPDLFTGTGNFTVPIALPSGRNGFQPQLSLSYSTGSGNGPFGLGWGLSVPGVSRKTSKGVPRYDDAQDTFILSGAGSFSFRQEFADQWYDLHNPDQATTPMTVRFKTTRADFPPNIDDLKIQQLALYFPAADGAGPLHADVRLRMLQGDRKPDLGGADGLTIDSMVSTRRGWNWNNFDLPPIGEWELALADPPGKLDARVRDVFHQDRVQDLFFVITYTGRTPEWPM